MPYPATSCTAPPDDGRLGMFIGRARDPKSAAGTLSAGIPFVLSHGKRFIAGQASGSTKSVPVTVASALVPETLGITDTIELEVGRSSGVPAGGCSAYGGFAQPTFLTEDLATALRHPALAFPSERDVNFDEAGTVRLRAGLVVAQAARDLDDEAAQALVALLDAAVEAARGAFARAAAAYDPAAELEPARAPDPPPERGFLGRVFGGGKDAEKRGLAALLGDYAAERGLASEKPDAFFRTGWHLGIGCRPAVVLRGPLGPGGPAGRLVSGERVVRAEAPDDRGVDAAIVQVGAERAARFESSGSEYAVGDCLVVTAERKGGPAAQPGDLDAIAARAASLAGA